MRLSFNKLLPLILSFLQIASGSSISDLITTLPSIRLVGSVSICIEGGSSPILYSRNVEFPLAPLGQRLLDSYDPTAISQIRPQISKSASHDDGGTIVMYEGAESRTRLSDEDDKTAENNEAMRAIDQGKEAKEERQMVLRRPQLEEADTAVLARDSGGAVKKRKADRREVEVADRVVVKRSKTDSEADKAEDTQASDSRKSKKHKRRSKEGKKKQKCCRHCMRGD